MVPVLREKLPHIPQVFQEWSSDAMLPRMAELDVLWCATEPLASTCRPVWCGAVQ